MQYTIDLFMKNSETGDLRCVEYSVEASSEAQAQAIARHHMEQMMIKQLSGQRTH